MRLRKLKPRKVIIHHEKMPESIEGILVDRVDGHYLVRGAKLIGVQARTDITVGEVLVPEAKVAFLQVVAQDGR